MSIQLISLADLKQFLQKDTTDDDALLTQIIKEVSSQIEGFLNRELKEVSRTKYFNGGKTHYYLPAYPINTSPAVVATVYDGVQTEDSDYYVWHDDGYIEFTYSPSRSLPKAVKIVWTGGYAETASVLAVPDDMKSACTQQCSYLFLRRDELGNSGTSGPDGNVSYKKSVDLLPNVIGTLQKYRNFPGQD